MTRVKIALLLLLGGLVSACGTTNVATRNAPFEPAPLSAAVDVPAGYETLDTAPADTAAASLPQVNVGKINVVVPTALKVSEANSYLPKGDIVWRGDPIGDRHAQVAAIFETAMQRGTAALDGAQHVTLDIVVKRFHALSEKARYTVGGVHNITFDLTLRDAATGAPIMPSREVRADLDALGGSVAIHADSIGQTQKVRITDHLAEVIRQELTQEGGFENPRLGLLQSMNEAS
ncbi:MAG: DUF6778 family protein [Pseudomonadota bacterium]